MKSIKDLKFDEHNFNLHTDEGMELLQKSVEQNGFGRSVLCDKHGNLISGNGIVETAIKTGKTKIKVVETQGDELVVVQRTDLDINTKEGRDMALADNVTAHTNLRWNDEELKKAREEWGVKLDEWGVEITPPNSEEVKKTQTEQLSKLQFEDIYYVPKKKPTLKLEDCVNLDKFNAKIKALDNYQLTDAQKEVLKLFAYRFIRIDFESVANYYAFNASEEEKRAIERLRLVLVDNAIDGFINDDLIRINNEIIDFAKDEENEE